MTYNCTLGSGIQLKGATWPFIGLNRVFWLSSFPMNNGSHGGFRDLGMMGNFIMRLTRFFQFKNSWDSLRWILTSRALRFGRHYQFWSSDDGEIWIWKFRNFLCAARYPLPVGGFLHPTVHLCKYLYGALLENHKDCSDRKFPTAMTWILRMAMALISMI